MKTYDTCKRCMGRGYLPEKRKPSRRNPNALGFYARTCPKCGGSGSIERKEGAIAPPKRTKAQVAKDEAEDKGYHDGRFGGYLPLETYNREELKAYNRGHTSGSKSLCRF